MDMRTDGKQTKKFRLPLFDIALLLLIAIRSEERRVGKECSG